MSQYEYQIIQMTGGGRVGQLNERMATMIAQGWAPVLMSGDATINVMLRRQVKQPAAPQADEQAQAEQQ